MGAAKENGNSTEQSKAGAHTKKECKEIRPDSKRAADFVEDVSR